MQNCPEGGLHDLAARTPTMLAAWEGELRCRYANAAYRDWFGVEPSALPGTSIQDLLGPALFNLNEPFIRGVLAGEAQVFERVIPGPGSTRHSLARDTPEKRDDEVVGFFVEVTDISAMKAVERTLLATVANLQQLYYRHLSAHRRHANNASKYTPAGGRIRIGATATPGWLEISVSDNGVGMPPASASSIFDAFKQLDHSLERSRGGIGIGLMLVKQIVEQHGGEVRASSAGTGLGATFTVLLPAAV